MIKISPDLGFEQAATQWIEARRIHSPSGRSRYVAPRTLWDYEQYARALSKFFAGVRLRDIDFDMMREYHRLRSIGGELASTESTASTASASKENSAPGIQWDRPAGPNKINQEVGLLKRILIEAGAWTPDLEQHYAPLQREEADIPRAMSPDEQALWLRTAASQQRWELVHWYSLFGIQTTCSTNELRGLQIADVNLYSRVLIVRAASAKNKYRIRTIPLTDEALWAVNHILDRARALGSHLPQHHIFPFRVAPGIWEPTQGMTESGIKKLWQEVRDASKIAWLRQYDLRHCGLTRLAEKGVPIPVMMSMAGHISRRMQQHYTHISEMAKRAAVESAFGKTYNDTAAKSKSATLPKPPKKQPSASSYRDRYGMALAAGEH